MNKEIKIDKQSILNAIKMIDEDPELLKGRSSFMYDLVYGNKTYPPILILSLANKLNGGEELVLNDFGGTEKPFKILKDLEFDIIKKNEEFTMRLRPKELIKYIFNTNLENIEKSILAQNKGLSALCLLYKTKMTHQELSEIFGDNVQFNNISTASVPEFIKEISRYCDVNVINIENEFNIVKKINLIDTKFNYKSFHEKTKEAGLLFSEKMVARFVASLCTKPFVICSGLSGSGKTKLAQAFVQWICESEEQYKIIPVGSDWTNREPLLGYPNAIETHKYVVPENGVLQLILDAIENDTIPYFLILDEMNLSHVERYFADFLSAMESGEPIPLHSIENDLLLIPTNITLPHNLFIIGTVNIDETTYMFSPKVLDRANTIEFRLNEEDLENYFNSKIPLEMGILNKKGISMAIDFVEIATDETQKDFDNIKKDLIDFFKELKKSGAEYGYRTASEIGRLVQKLEFLGEKDDDLLDIAIMQKLLPKLHGSRSKLSKVLITLGSLCLNDANECENNYFKKIDEIDFINDKNIKYKLSFEKIIRMYKNALDNGFASYAEA